MNESEYWYVVDLKITYFSNLLEEIRSSNCFRYSSQQFFFAILFFIIRIIVIVLSIVLIELGLSLIHSY